jgi:hypothetical protein
MSNITNNLYFAPSSSFSFKKKFKVFPPEIRAHIFSFLPPKDQGDFFATANKINDKLWENFSVSQFNQIKLIPQTLVFVSQFQIKVIPQTLVSVRKLQSLNLQDNPCDLKKLPLYTTKNDLKKEAR